MLKNITKVSSIFISFIFSLSGYEREVDKWKKALKYYSLNVITHRDRYDSIDF